MLISLFVLPFLIINLPRTCHCTECFDFQCFDGEYANHPNCFQCKNISVNSRNQWLEHIKRLISIAKKLKKHEYVKTLEKKIKDGMYCCYFDDTNKFKTCSLTFSYGSKDGLPHFGMGCTNPGFWYSPTCNNKNIGSRCCRQNHCNGPNVTELQYMWTVAKEFNPLIDEVNDQNHSKYTYIIVIVISILSVCIIGGAIYCLVTFFKSGKGDESKGRPFYKKILCLLKLFTFVRGFNRRKKTPGIDDTQSYNESLIGNKQSQSIQLRSYEDITCSGSGAGKPLMTRRTAATDINLICRIGEGRFGTVWLGKWNGDNVAVKIFSTRDERSWDREKQIYQKNFLRHSNVLGYVATDSRDNGLATELWLVTDYHENGSLYEYLQSHVLSIEQAVKMSRSITNGLAYLHMEINGIDLRPGIAHRDLKSRNILVKSCGECCIGDLGLAVRLNEDFLALDMNRVGTRRYMAPEVILDSIILTELHYNGGLEAFKKADIYSCSLVLWEILQCCECPSMKIMSSPYQMPYQTMVSNDPSIEEMREIVCERKIRPPMNKSWDNLNPLKEISKSIQESWFDEPASRLTIMRLKKIMQTVWNEVCTLKSTVTDISGNDNVAVPSDSYGYKYPFSNSTVSTEFPSSLTSNDIPNIVIKTKDNVLITDPYSLGSDLSLKNDVAI